MGAWAEDSFGNDSAADWAGQFAEGGRGLEAVVETLNAVMQEGEDYLDSDFAADAIAACEVIARLRGHWGKRSPYSEKLDAWVESHPQEVPQDLLQLALRVLERILGENSELQQLWDDGGRNEAWHAEMDDLKRRVGS